MPLLNATDEWKSCRMGKAIPIGSMATNGISLLPLDFAEQREGIFFPRPIFFANVFIFLSLPILRRGQRELTENELKVIKASYPSGQTSLSHRHPSVSIAGV